jgi:hypothetical protein
MHEVSTWWRVRTEGALVVIELIIDITANDVLFEEAIL